MNRTTLIALAGFVALLAVVLVMKYVPEETAEASLTVGGWKAFAEAEAKKQPPAPADADGADGEEGADKKTPEKIAAVDRVELVRGGEKIVIVRKGAIGDDRKEWTIEEPRKASAEWFRLRSLLNAFEEERQSSLSKAVQASDLPLFKLDEAQRIGIKLSHEGKVIADLWIGGTEKADSLEGRTGPEGTDTWVMTRADGARAYRIPGADLRTPVDKELGELRSKKMLTAVKEEVVRLVVENPDDKKHPRIVLVRETPGSSEVDDGGAGAGEDKWSFETPADYRPGDVTRYLQTVLALNAVAFLPADDAAALAALDNDAARITVETGDGSIVLTVSKPVGDDGYVKIDGRDELYKVGKWGAENLRKTLGDLRDKRAFRFEGPSVTAVSLQNEKGTLSARLTDRRWAGEKPAGLAVGQKPMETLARDIAGFQVDQWLGNVPPRESGLDAPAQRITVEAAGGVHTLILSKAKDNKVYGTVVGSAEVFQAADWRARKLSKGAQDLRDKRVVPAAAKDVTRVELHDPAFASPVVMIRRDAGGWAMESPEKIDALKPLAERLVATLAGLEAKSVSAEKKAADVGLGAHAKAFFVVAQTATGGRYTVWLGDEAGAKAGGGDVWARTDAPGWDDLVFTLPAAKAGLLRTKPAELKP